MTDTPAKAAIVTGASGGIGRAVALRLASDGFAVVANYAGNAAKADEAVTERPACRSSASSFKPARAMAGSPSRKENRAASSRLKPRKSAAVNVEPERDTPGINAPTCAIPTTRQSRSPTRSIDR